MKANVKWIDEARYVAETGSGHSLVLDGSPEIGGRDVGARPMEMVLVGLGGCTSMDVVFILKKSRQPVEGVEVEVEAERSDSVPKVFTKIHVHFKVSGADLEEKHVKRAVDLSAEKYCSVSMMLNKACEVTHSYELIGN